MEYFKFWFSKWVIEVVFGIGFIVIIYSIAELPRVIREFRCKHDKGVREDFKCDAICRKCGKNLGFIGTWREQNKEGDRGNL